MESGLKVFYNIPPLNDRIYNPALDNFLVKLGFLKQRVDVNTNTKSTKRRFSFFRHKS